MADHHDEVMRQIELDELSDATKLTPRDFAKLIGRAPQLVYYYIRTNKIDVEICQCGRKVIDVKQAKEVFGIDKDLSDS